MATESSLHIDSIHAELIGSLAEILQSLQQNPKYNLRPFIPLLPTFRFFHRAIRNYGKELPQKELQWLKKLQTIQPPEESLPVENYPTAHATTQDDATRATSPAKASSTGDATAQDDASIARKKKPTYKNIAYSLIDDEVITHFKEKDKNFKSWTCDPGTFFSSSRTQEQERPGTTRNDRIKSFHENSAEQKPNVEAQNLIRRLDSLLAYLRYQNEFPTDKYILLSNVETFIEKIGIPKDEASKHLAVLLGGRRRLQFCHLVSNKTVGRSNVQPDVNFNDADYGILFLDIDDKIWDSQTTKNSSRMKKTVDELKLRDITEISEKSGAKVAAKTLLQFRQACVEDGEPPAPSDAQKNYSTSESAPSNTEKNNDMVLAKRTRAESDLNDMRASKRARTELEPDGMRTSKSTPSDVEPNNATVPERAHGDQLDVLLQAAKYTGQNAAASKINIANPISNVHTMQQPSNQLLSASEANITNPISDVHAMQSNNNLPSASEYTSSLGMMGAVSNELLLEPVEDYFNSLYTMDDFSNPDPFVQYECLPEGPLVDNSGEPDMNGQPSF